MHVSYLLQRGRWTIVASRCTLYLVVKIQLRNVDGQSFFMQ